MGYGIRLREAELFIDAAKADDALAAIRTLMSDGQATSGRRRTTDSAFAYMDGVRPEEWDYLKEAMQDWRFPIELDTDRNVVGISFTGEKAGDERQMFEAIAPYVQVGSYIEFVGAEGDRFRYVFTEETVTREEPEVSY